MFDVGFWEIAIIVLIALIVLGPERLPRTARSIGLWVGKARRTLAEVKRDIDRELDETDLKQIKGDLSETKNIFEEAAQTMNENVVTEADFEQAEPKDSPSPEEQEKSKKPKKPSTADSNAAT